ncbi:MAG: translocation/assembly module TamB, partial [Alistipes sp.]|nr:translocation/assembly module TamB [Alistipes sp.]
DGRIDNRRFSGEINSADSNMTFRLNGIIDMERAMPTYDFEMNLRHADLHATGINRRDTTSLLSLDIDAHASGLSIDDLDGRITLYNARYEYPDGEIAADRISLDSRNDADSKYIKLSSQFVDATFVSKTSYSNVMQYLARCLHSYIPLLYDNRSTKLQSSNDRQTLADDFSIVNVNVKDINPLMNAIADGWQIAEGSSVQMLFNPVSNSLTVQARSDYIERNMMLATNLRLNANNLSDSLSMYLNADDLYIGSLHMPNFSVTGGAQHSRIKLTAGFRDARQQLSGMLGLSAGFSRNAASGKHDIHIDVAPSTITTRDKTWKIFSRGIDIESDRIAIDSFSVIDAGEQMVVDGIASRSRQDSLELTLRNFDISPLAKIVERWGYRVEGRTNGHATVKSALHAGEITADIDLDDIRVNDLQAPPTRLTSKWDFEQNRARIIISDRQRGDTIIRGYYQPSRNRYFARARLDNMPLSLISPFLQGVVSETEGTADIDVNILGEGRKASLNGDIHVDSLSTKVDFTQTRYHLSDADLRVADNHIYAERIPIFDKENNRGTYTMDLSLEHLSNITYNIRLDIDKMLVLDTDADDNDLFYGHVYASGDASFRGDKRGLKMNIEATSEDNSTFFMPLAGKSDVSYADFVKFESAQAPVDTTSYLIRRKMAFERKHRQAASASSIMDIDLICNVRPNTEIQLVIDPTVGDIIKARGEGQLSMRIVPKTNVFEMFGDYTINEGSYLFTLQNIWTKKFVIAPGSSIHWTGDPLGARLNIDAVYNLKASLQPLLEGMSNNNYTRAVPVECYIKLTDELMSPTVTFDIKVPNLDPEIQSIVQSLLTSQQDIATQMFWLLMANSFNAENNSGIGANVSATTGFELLSNQLSNWLSGDNYNIIFRYRPKSNTTSDEVDFGFSKSWIDNRLTVELEGNYMVDNTSKVTENASNLMGEAYITWLIDKGGNFKFRGFTQTIDRYDENQGLQETGIGFYYSENFNTFKELAESIRNRFSNEERRRKRIERRTARKQQKSGQAAGASSGNTEGTTPETAPKSGETGNNE